MYHPSLPVVMNDGVLTLPIMGESDSALLSLDCEARVALVKIKEGRGMNKSCWGVSLLGCEEDTLKVTLQFGNRDYGDFLDRKIARVTVERNGVVLAQKEVEGFVGIAGAYNSIGLKLTGSRLSVTGGGHKPDRLIDVTLDAVFSPHDVALWSRGAVKVSMFVAESGRQPSRVLASGWDIERLTERFRKSDDPLEGFWAYFDRQNDPAYARLGGRYRLAIVRRGEHADPFKEYDMVLVDGAQTLASRWEPMMLKGRLKSTVFQDHYDMEWIDSTFEPLTEDVHAALEETALLTLSFPMYKTVIRFSKEPRR